MIRLSASRADLIDSSGSGGCVHPFTKSCPLPAAGRGRAADETRLGWAWKRVHAKVISEGMGTRPAFLVDEALKFEGLDPEKWRQPLHNMHPIESALDLINTPGRLTAQADAAFAYNPKSASAPCRQLDRGIKDLGTVPDDHPVGIADVMWTESDPASGTFTLVIRQFVLGQGARDRQTEAQESGHLAMLAYLGGMALSADAVRTELRYVLPDGRMVPSDYTWSMMELLTIEQWLITVMGRIASDEGPKPGAYCSSEHCPMLVTCEATLEAAKQIERSLPPMIVRCAADLTSEDQVKMILSRSKAVKAQAEYLIEQCQEWVRRKGTPLAISPGKFWGPKSQRTESVHAKSCAELICELKAFVPENVAERIVYATASKSALETAITANSPPREGKRRTREAMSALRRSQMLAVSTQEGFRTFGKKLPEPMDTAGEPVEDDPEETPAGSEDQ